MNRRFKESATGTDFNDLAVAEGIDTVRHQHEAETTDKPQFQFIHNADILANLSPIEWRIQNILIDNSLYYDFGDPETFKTFVALDRLGCIAAGIDYHGHPVKQGTVFYIAGEGQQGIGRRIEAWHIAHGTKAKDVPFFLARTPTQLMNLKAIDEVREARFFNIFKGVRAETFMRAPKEEV